MRNVKTLGVVLGMLCLSSAVALAAPINYGDFSDIPPGSTSYLQVTESSGTDPVPPGRFGAPTITGDTLDFDPKEFVASAINAVNDITDVQLNFDVVAQSGTGITSLLFSEQGDFTLAGTGSNATQVAAGLAVQVKILEVDGVALGSPVSTFVSSSILRDLVNDGPVVSAPWSNGVLIDFLPVLAANNIPVSLGVTKAEVVLNNTLLAISEPQSIAFIAKKDFVVEAAVIPEPATLMLLGLGVLAAAPRRRRAA